MSNPSLFVIKARRSRSAVIFRRGPSKQVLLLKWNLQDDTFESGQWFKGRIYERRCDLSPDGDKLIYFAANYRTFRGPPTWTAVSRPPYLKALAMWPKGDAWGGGGLFEDDHTIQLNHQEGDDELAKGFALGKGIRVKPFGEFTGSGEDDPLYHTRLIRDGWVLKQQAERTGYSHSGPMNWVFTQPEIYEKTLTRKGRKFALQAQLQGIGERGGLWYPIDHQILDEQSTPLITLPRTSWADWDQDGSLLFAEGGKLFRLEWTLDGGLNRVNEKELIDLSATTFMAAPTPAVAAKW